jgi:hypothetical protein
LDRRLAECEADALGAHMTPIPSGRADSACNADMM